MGRGTTVVEAALCGRTPAGCDINPLSAILARPRLAPPTVDRSPTGWRRSICRARFHVRESSRCFTTRTRSARSARCASICSARESERPARRRGPMDPHGGGESPHRPFAGFLLRLHAAAESGRIDRRSGTHQRIEEAGSSPARCSRAHRRKDTIAAERLRCSDAHDAAPLRPDARRSLRARRDRPRSCATDR